jgi:hypothetical protein
MLRKLLRGLTLTQTVVALVVGVFLSALVAAPASAADPSGSITGFAGKCVDVAGADPANGTPVVLYDCNGTNAQRWTVAGDGTLRALGKCLDIVDWGTGNGSKVQIWDCTASSNQKWVVTAAHDIVNPAANKCLDVTDNNPNNGTRLQIWDCAGTANQKWNAPTAWSGCPDQAICLYKNGGGTGSKVIIGGYFGPGTSGRVRLDGVNFLDGSGANNQVSSWLNNTNCSLTFIDNPDGDSPTILDSAPGYHYGRTGDWTGAYANDKLSMIQIDWC